MAESNRVVEALKKLRELQAEEVQAMSDAADANNRRQSATRGIQDVLRQVEWGVGPNKPERAVSVDGVVFVIRYRKDDAVKVEQLVVEGL